MSRSAVRDFSWAGSCKEKNPPLVQRRGRSWWATRAAAMGRPLQNYFELCCKPAAEVWASAPSLRVGLSNSELCLSSVSGLVWVSTLKVPVLAR